MPPLKSSINWNEIFLKSFTLIGEKVGDCLQSQRYKRFHFYFWKNNRSILIVTYFRNRYFNKILADENARTLFQLSAHLRIHIYVMYITDPYIYLYMYFYFLYFFMFKYKLKERVNRCPLIDGWFSLVPLKISGF